VSGRETPGVLIGAPWPRFHFGGFFGMKGQKAVGISMSGAESSPKERLMPEAIKSLISKSVDHSV
jgi:hypothetical protein